MVPVGSWWDREELWVSSTTQGMQWSGHGHLDESTAESLQEDWGTSPAPSGWSSSMPVEVFENSLGQGPRRETFQTPNPASEEPELNTTRRNDAFRNVPSRR